MCGGRHAPKDCLDKRRLTVEQADDVIASGSVAAAREEQSELPRPSQEESSASSSMPPQPSSSKNFATEEAAAVRPSKRARGEDQPTAEPARPVPRQKAKARQMREPHKSDPEDFFDRWAAESAGEVAATAGMAAKLLERPTLIYVTQFGGIPFLGPLLTANNRHLFGPITMQITCVGKSPEQRGGITLPGARLFQFELVNAATRDAHWNELFAVLQQNCATAKEPWFTV